jgi:hypothetical protein
LITRHTQHESTGINLLISLIEKSQKKNKMSEYKDKIEKYQFETNAIHAGQEPDQW